VVEKGGEMKTLGIDHIVIAVKDIEKATEFFSELFETSFEELEPPEGAQVRTKICPEGVELISSRTPGSPVEKFIEGKGEGLYGLSFRVVNFQKATEDVKKKGIRIIGKAEKDQLGRDVFNLKELFLHPKDAFGVQLLLTQYETTK
jgi:methylmalonyl-CoA/ethylmalonyl-CoA epimerase